VTATSAGHATLTWTYASTGSWSGRAEALANPNYAASPWSPRIGYTVR
jgi:hypothetical protein